MFSWFTKFRQKRNTKKFIKAFLDNSSNSIILKRWEHCTWGDAIYTDGNGLHGCLSGLRNHSGFLISHHCDLRNRDVLVIDVPKNFMSQSNGKKYDIGLFANVRITRDPADMFFAQYVRLGFADDYSKETIIKLANERIASL